MQDNDTSRRRKFYDQMSETYDLGSFDEFNTKMDSPESREKLFKYIDGDGKFDIGDFDYFDKAMAPAEKQSPEQTAPVQQVSQSGKTEYPQPYDAAGNPITNNGEPYSQEVLSRYYSQDNQGENRKDLSQIVMEMQQQKPVSEMHTTQGTAYIPPAPTIAEQEEAFAEQMRRLHDNADWRNKEMTLQPAASQQPVRSTQGEIFDQLYGTFDEAYRNGQMGGRSAYSLTREAAERMGIDDDEKMTVTNKLLGAVNRRYAKDKAAEAVKTIMDKMPESSDNPIDALQAAYYDRDLQQQLMTTAAKMGNDYQDYVNMFLKPQIVEAMKQKYGGTDADWSSVRGLFSNWEHVKDRLEHQDVSGLLSEHFAPAIDQAINDAYEQALGVESEHEQTHQAGPQFSTGNMSGLVNDILAKKKGNEIRDPEAIRERFEQVLFGRKAGTDSQEQADSSQEDERMLSMAVKEIMTDDNLSKEVFERSGKAGMNTVDYIRKYVLPEMLQSVRNQFEKAFIEKEMPKSTAEYILKGLTEDNIIMMLANRYMRTGEQQRYANMADAMTQQGKNEAVDPGILAQGARLATGMASDFWLWSGWGKIGQAAAGELLAQRVAQRAAADHITRAAAARLIEEEGKQFLKKGVVENMMRHIPQSAVTLGGAEGTSEAVRGIRDREDAAAIIGNTIGAAAQGATTGTMFGITGGLTGRLTSQLSGAKRLAGKIAGFGTEAATMYTAEELQKMAQGEDAFRNPFDGLIESGIKLGFIKLSANPLATGERLLKAIANPVKAIKEAGNADKPLLTEDDVKDITESKDGKTLMDALTSMRPARSTDGQEREGYIGEADAEIAAEAYRNYMTDPNRPWERKQKVAHLLGGMIEPPGHEVKADITAAGDGAYVRTYDLDKNVIRETRYDSREDAEKAVADMDQDIDDNITAALDERINKIDAYERFGEFFEQGYQKAAEKTGAGTEAGVGEALTDQDRQFIYLHQHKDELLDVYKKIASGESLGVDEQQLADEYMKTFRAFVEKGIASQDFMREFEQATGLPEGTLRKAIEGTETENGRQRTDLQQQIVDAYRLTAMKYIAEKEGRQQETQQFAEDRLTGDVPAEEQRNGNIYQENIPDESNIPGENIPAEQISDQTQEQPAQESVETETPMPEGTTERREAAYNKGLSVASDPSVLTSIGHDERLIMARMNQMQSDERLSRLVKACISASETGDTTEAERLLADQQDTMTPEQVETVSQYLDILETRNGIEDAVIRQTQDYGDQQREQLKTISAPDGTVTPLQLKDGTIVYYKSGDLSNHYGGVIVTDEAGQNRQVPVFSITDVMPTETVDDIVERRVNDYAATLQQQYAALSTGIPSQGQQVSMILLGQRVTATMAGTDAQGNLVFQFEDGSMMPISTEDAGQAIMAADDQDIQAQLQQEADKTRQAEQQQRFATGIQGYTEGKPDITAPGTDPTVAAEYLKTQIPDDKARRQQLTSIQSNKEQLAAEKVAAEKEIERLNEWLQGNEDMATEEEVSQAKERITELERTIAEGEARNRNYGEIRRRLMTADELADMERERRKEISKATGSYTPQPPVRKLTTNEDRITMEDGKPNFGLTSVANANNYLLKTYPDSIDAERFITGERLALRNRQRDEVQPQINAASDILNSYITGIRDLTNQEVQDLAHRLADLEAYQSALSQDAVNLRQIAEGIPALYERNRETAPMTAEEQRLSRLDKAVGREDKIRIAEDIYQGYPEALDIIKNREPRDVYEYIADNLGTNSINWEGIERGGRHVRGLQEELGRGWERGIGKGYSTNAFNMYLAAKGEGKGIEEIVHDLYEGQPDVQGEHPYSDVDIRNALLDMFSTAQKPSDISHRIIDNRIAEAEESVKAEEERYRELEREAQNVNDVKENGNQEENAVSLQQANESLQAVIDETAEEISVAPSRIVNNEADLDTLKAAKVGDEFLDKIRQDLADEATVGRYIPELGMIVFYAEKMDRLGMTPEEKKASIYHENVHALSRLGYTREDYAKTAALINAEYIMDEVLSVHAEQSEDVRNEEVTGYFVQAIINGGPAEDFLSGTYSESSPELNVRINEISNILRNGQQELQVRTGLELEGAPEAEARPGEAARADSAAADQGINVGQDYQKEDDSFPARLAEAKAETDTEPTEAQKKAGNYKMGHISFGGYQMSIENPKGSTRSGVDRSGTPWSIEMKDTYGYIGKKYGADGDHLDFFINDEADLDSFQGRVYIVDQKNDDGTFDEHKVMYGYPNWSAARNAYSRNYESGWWDKHVMQMTGVRKEDFDKWLSDSDRKTKPFAEYYRTRMADTTSDPAEDILAAVKDREEAAARYSEQQQRRDAIAERLAGEDTTSDNAVSHLADAYSTGDKNLIHDITDRIRDLVINDQQIEIADDPNGDWVDEYEGEDPKLKAEKYIVRLGRHFFLDYDEDIPYIVTGIESPKGRPAVPEPIRYEVEEFLAADRKLTDGKLKGAELTNAMRRQSNLAAKLRPSLERLQDDQLTQTLEALKDFKDSSVVEAVLMEQQRRSEIKDAMDEVMEEVDKRRQASVLPVAPTVTENEMEHMDDDTLMQRRHKAMADKHTALELIATNSRLKPGTKKYEQLASNIMQADADVAAIDEELEKRLNIGAAELQIEDEAAERAAESTVRRRVTDAVLTVLDDAKVPVRKVSQQEADRMMGIFTAMNSQAIIDQARAMRPDPMKRYAVVNIRDPFAVPKYFEKKTFAREYQEWGRRMGGEFHTFNLANKDMSEAAEIMTMMGKKRTPETAVPGETPFKATVVSDVDAAKIQNNLESIVNKLENLSSRRLKTFVGDIAKAIGAERKGSGSQYVTFEAKNGTIVTLRLADHNAKVSNFDNSRERNGVSIVISRKPSTGITNDGEAHIVEYFYPDKALRKAEGNPYASIVKSIEQMLYSGEYNDTTGLAQREEVNIPDDIQMQIDVWHGSGNVFTKFDHSHMGEGTGSQTFGYGTYLSDSKNVAQGYAETNGDQYTYRGKPISADPYSDHAEERALFYMQQEGSARKAIHLMQALISDEEEPSIINDYEETINVLRKTEDFDRLKRNLYQVEIPDENEAKYIAYKEKMGDQKDILDMVDNALTADGWKREEFDGEIEGDVWFSKQNGHIVLNPLMTGGDLYYAIEDGFSKNNALDADKQTSQFLYDAGITGIKYPAGTIMGGGEGATNYVIFNPDDAKIVQHIQFMMEGDAQQPTFFSNAMYAVDHITQDKATPEQWLAMITKNGGIKAGEDKWLGLSDWLKSQDKKSLTKQEVMDYIRQNQIQVEETEYAENVDNSFDDEIIELWHHASGNNYDKAEEVNSRMIEKYGEDFRKAAEVWYDGSLRVYDQALLARIKNGEDAESPINDTRLSYTTDGLENKREIALVVPSVEPYNEHDEVHFGDAGGGRAVAWVRFGETTDKDGKKVLVIDEIQSKRHQDAREKGYKDPELEKKISRLNELNSKMDAPEGISNEEYDELQQLRGEGVGRASFETSGVPAAPFEKNWHELAMKRMLRYAAENGYDKIAWTTGEQQAERYDLGSVVNRIDVANWGEDINEGKLDVELGYKEPSSYLPENDVEKAIKEYIEYCMSKGDSFALSVAYAHNQINDAPNESKGWTDEAVEKVADAIEKDLTGYMDARGVLLDIKNGDFIDMTVTKEGKIIDSFETSFEGKSLADIVGKDMALKIIGTEGKGRIAGNDLHIGGEGMKGFYDQILPRFMDKYGKKWGVKVEEVDLPKLQPSAQKMWSIDVTPDMRASVMQGQPMFQAGQGGCVYGWTDGKDIFLTPDGLNPNTPIHEYTHIWDLYIQKHDPELWKEMVETFKQTAVWKQLRENQNYRNIWDDDNRMASEVHSRLTGAAGEEEFTSAAAGDEQADIRGIIDKVKDVIRRFWEAVARLFGKQVSRIDEFIRMPLRDLLEGRTIINDEASRDILYQNDPDVIQRDKEYADAVAAGDKEKVDAMLREEADRKGYTDDSEYQGSKAFNGAAPSKNGYFETREERKQALEDGNFEGEFSLGDFVEAGIDANDLGWQLSNQRAATAGDKASLESIQNINNAIRSKSGKITMYRAVDADIKENSFRNGDWVTPSRKYAMQHIELQDWKKGRIIEQEVPIDDIWWNGDDINEWGYDDGKTYAYKNTKNNRKLMEPTYDADGNLIPLSQRFNSRKKDVMFHINGKISILEGNLFEDKDFMADEKNAKGKKIADLTDQQLLKVIRDGDGEERRKHVDEYDRRHQKELDDAYEQYSTILNDEATSLSDAYNMYDNVWKEWTTGGFATSDRTRLMGQIDALEGYINYMEEEEKERRLEEEEENAAIAERERYEQQQEEIRQNTYDLTKLRIRPLKEGESCHVERRYQESKVFAFTGTDHITDANDVAYIFRSLQNAAVENSFLVLQKDGVPTIIHLAMGDFLGVSVPVPNVYAAYEKIQPDKVWFIHNHPSGNLIDSRQDRDTHISLGKVFGEKLQPSIIIDTTSGKYAVFTAAYTMKYDIPTSSEKELPLKVYSFDKQVFDKDWNPEKAFQILNERDIAAFVSSHRLGKHDKMSLLVLDQAGHVTANLFLPYTNIVDAFKSGQELIRTYVAQMGGVRCVIYGNYEYKEHDAVHTAAVESIKKMLLDQKIGCQFVRIENPTASEVVEMKRLEDAYSDDITLNEAVDMKGRIALMSPDELISNYRRVNSQMLDEDGLDVDQQDQKVRDEHRAKYGLEGIGKAAADHLQMLAKKYTYKKLMYRWELLDRIEELGLTDRLSEKPGTAKTVKFTPMRKAAGGKDKKIREDRQIVTKIAADETADNLGGVKVKYVSGSDITDAGLKMENEKGTLGLYDPNDGSVTLFLDNIADADEARRTVCHEKLGHEGLVAIFGSQDEVNRFGQFVFDSASKDIRRRIIERADEEGYSWSDHQRFSKAAQEVLADIAADGPRTADEFSLWRKVKHYLIEWLNKIGLRVRCLLNDHDLAYYILKTGEALKRWNSMPKDQQTAAAAQQPQYTVMRSRRGRPRKRNDESMAQYLERLREWEMWKEAEQRAAEANDPMPDADAINKKYEQQFNADLAEWRKNHNIPEGQTSAGEFPKRRPDETPQDYAVRVADYESLADTWKDAPRLFDYLQKANEEHKEAYRAWKERYGIREKENVDLNMYENTTSDTTPEIESRLERDLAEAVGVDMSSEGARKHAKMSLIERRKNLEGANAEDAVWIHDMVRRIDRIAKANGVSGKEVREVMMFMIEADRYRYFKDQEKQEAIAMVNTSDVFMKNHSFITEENLLAIKPEMVAAGDAYTAWQAVPSDPKREKAFHDAAIRLAEKLNSLNKDADGYHDIFGDEIMRIFPTLLHASVAGGGSAMPTSAESYMQFDGMKELLTDIKDWYDYFYHQIEDAGLRNDAGYIADGYINHIWDREKSDPKAWEKYVENYQRTKSPNMKEREIPTYMQGIEVGLVPKYRDVADIMAYYSASNNEAIANKKFLDSLSFIVVEELNNTGEVVSILPLLDSKRPDLLVSDRYKEYHVPGVGDVWVLKDVQRMFANVFGTMRTQDVPDWLSKLGKGYDLLSSVAKKIQLSFSAFHMGALTEVALAQMRPDRALKALAQYIIFDCAKKGTLPAYAHPDDFKMAARHLVQLGATQDYSAADVNNVTEKLRNFVRELADSEEVVKKGAGYAATPIAAALDFINKGMDTVLWNYLHDGLKIACFKMFAEQIEDRVEKEGLTADQREQLLDEAGQYVNDTFGGQYWELINVSPALLKWLRRAFLSPDWLISTQRHFLANLGFGSLYSESGFLNYLEYNKDNIKRAFGADIPRNENRRFRSKNAKQCYILGVCGFFYIMMNALNAMMRSWDEQKEKAKADEIRQDNPGYLSPYELAYPDGMKWYDYTMYGNTIGQSTHLFMGRYNDGTEWYARWGKQFREFPELFIGRHGLEFPTPLMERMSGKANPIGRYLLYDLPLTVGMYGYQQPRDTKEIASKYGNMAAVTAMTAKKFLPFSVPTQKDKEFKLMDLVMPSQKGFTRWKTVDYFTTYIQAGDMDGVSRTYNAAVMNGIDAEDCLKAAISTIRATQRRELKDGITDLQTAMERFDAAKTVQDRKALRTTIFKYLAEQNYKAITKSEALEQVDAFLNGEQPTEQEINGYIGHAAATDIRDDYRVQLIEKQAKKFTDEVRTAEGSRQQRLRDNYQAWFEAENLIKRYKKSLKKSSPGYDWWKRQLGKDPVTKPDGTVIDDNYRLEQIRTMRREMIEKIDALR